MVDGSNSSGDGHGQFRPSSLRFDSEGDNEDSSNSSLERRETLIGLGLVGLSLLVPSAVVAQDDDEEPADEEAEEDEDEPAADSVTVDVVDYAYEPGTDSPLEIPPGTEVEFVWQTDNHNIAVDEQPDEADWDGHEPLEDTGFEISFTFDVEGEYEYHCTPHIGLGMVATIIVDPDADVGNGAEAGPVDLVPETAMTLVIATSVSMIAVLGLSYAFLKYGGDSGGR